jgi:phosphate starvation-inducible PhoH-like protein
MTQGDQDLSRARGHKAQQRKTNQHQQQHQHQNTIDFHTAKPQRHTPINLIPHSRAQEQLVMALLDPDIPVVTAMGPAGTGKSYLAMLAAMRDLRDNRCQRIVITRPAVGVEDERHGFLPGDLTSKMQPWTRPLLDIVREFYPVREIQRMIESEIIEIAPLAFMRGRTFRDAWIVADEMQNATPNQVRMLLTRIGKGSRIVITGDIEQTDRARPDNGLWDLVDRLDQAPTPGIQVCRLGRRDIQRHPIIDRVLQLYS